MARYHFNYPRNGIFIEQYRDKHNLLVADTTAWEFRIHQGLPPAADAPHRVLGSPIIPPTQTRDLIAGLSSDAIALALGIAALPPCKDFKIAAISTNTNSFGLKQFVFIAQDGSSWWACGNHMLVDEYRLNRLVGVPLDEHGQPRFYSLGFELGEPTPAFNNPKLGPPIPAGQAPPDVVAETWPASERVILEEPGPH